jgi:hypothetical protein
VRAAGLAAVVVLAASPAAAATWLDKEVQALPCRPTVACTADIVPPGAVEIELGYQFRKLHDSTDQHSIPFLAKLSLAEWVQLQVGGNGPSFNDVVAGLKLHLNDQSRLAPSLSWSVALSTRDLLTTIYLTKDFAWLHVDLNFGVDLWRLAGPTKTQPWVALALSVGLPRHFTLMAENYYFADASPIAQQDGGLLVALAWAPRPFVVLDLGGDAGYFQSHRSFSVFVGMTIVPVDLWQTASERRKHPRER